MKILALNFCNYIDYPLGGELTFVKNLISAFGKDIKLVGISTDSTINTGEWTKQVINGIEYDYFSIAKVKKTFKRTIIPQRIKAFIKLKPHISKILTTTEYDRIFVQSPEILMCIPNKFLSKTFVVMPGVENPLSISRYSYARKLQKIYDFFFMRKIKHVKHIFASADEQELKNFILRSNGKIKREQIIKYPTRYDSTIYFENDKVKSREQLGLSPSAKIIITVGRLAWFKGWKFMVDSLEIVLKYQPDTFFYFIGDGEDRNKIEEYIIKKNLAHNIILQGSLPPQQVALFLNAADTFIMGSYKEGWSTTLVEACACCVPCVVTNFSSAEEMIKDGINGYVIKSRSIEKFATQILESLKFDRKKISEFNNKYKSFAVNKMRESLENYMYL